jgi:hypothetical protein
MTMTGQGWLSRGERTGATLMALVLMRARRLSMMEEGQAISDQRYALSVAVMETFPWAQA